MKRIALVLILLLVASVATAAFLDSAYRLPIIMYHSINHTSGTTGKTVVSPEALERQMRFLRERKYNVITLAEAVSYLSRKARPPRNTVAITIDDGYEDNFMYAYPILKKYRIPATIFIIVGHVGNAGFMRWDQIKEMSNSGLIDIESHTVHHPWLTGLGAQDLEQEMSESRKILEGNLGKKIRFLCYPMGCFNERVKQAAKNAGYEAAFGTKQTRLSANYDLYEIKRVRVSPTANNLFVFWIKLCGYHAFFKAMGS